MLGAWCALRLIRGPRRLGPNALRQIHKGRRKEKRNGGDPSPNARAHFALVDHVRAPSTTNNGEKLEADKHPLKGLVHSDGHGAARGGGRKDRASTEGGLGMGLWDGS